MSWCCCIDLVILFIFPIYKTLRALNSNDRSKEVFLAYWAIITLLCVVECVTFGLLPMIPLYGTFKAVLAVWMYHGDYNGSLWIFHNVISKYWGLVESKAGPILSKVPMFLGESEKKDQ